MKKQDISHDELLDMLHMQRRNRVFWRAWRFIQQDTIPCNSDIWVAWTADANFSSRRNRKPLIDADRIGASWHSPDHGQFIWILADVPEAES